MHRSFRTFVGIDLGGARGKTTAVAQLTLGPALAPDPSSGVVVDHVSTRRSEREPWHDDALIEYLAGLGDDAVVAVNAPLTSPACVRCRLAVCPGKEACVEPAVIWLESVGQDLASRAADSDRLAAVTGASSSAARARVAPRPSARIEPYVHRCCEVRLHYQEGVLQQSGLGLGLGPIAARAGHLRRQLERLGWSLHERLLEVRVRDTVHALFGERAARGYRRDADPWHVRASIVEGLDDLRFSVQSRLAREGTLSNDHCFDALMSAYTGYLWARDGWTLPDGVFAEDGWIWVPPVPRY